MLNEWHRINYTEWIRRARERWMEEEKRRCKNNSKSNWICRMGDEIPSRLAFVMHTQNSIRRSWSFSHTYRDRWGWKMWVAFDFSMHLFFVTSLVWAREIEWKIHQSSIISALAFFSCAAFNDRVEKWKSGENLHTHQTVFATGIRATNSEENQSRFWLNIRACPSAGEQRERASTWLMSSQWLFCVSTQWTHFHSMRGSGWFKNSRAESCYVFLQF